MFHLKPASSRLFYARRQETRSIISLRKHFNAGAGGKAGFGGWLVFFFTPVVGFFDHDLGYAIGKILIPGNMEQFILGSLAAFGITGSVAGYNREQLSAAELSNVGSVADASGNSVSAARVGETSPPLLVPVGIGESATNGASATRLAPTFEALDIAQLRSELIIDEGYRDHIYPDTEGHPTLGIGHLVKPGDVEHGQSLGTRVSDEQIQKYFTADVSQALEDAKAWLPKFNDHPETLRRAVVNMAFNLGLTRLKKFRKTRALLKARKYAEAADEALNSKWADQVGSRADRVAKRIRMADADIKLA